MAISKQRVAGFLDYGKISRRDISRVTKGTELAVMVKPYSHG